MKTLLLFSLSFGAFAQTTMPISPILSADAISSLQQFILNTPNGAASAVSAAIAPADTTLNITVPVSVTLPGVPFSMRIDAEGMVITAAAVTGQTAVLTALRGTLGTTATNHLVAATAQPLVYPTIAVLLKKAIGQVVAQIMQQYPPASMQTQAASVAAAQAAAALIQANAVQ